MSNIEERVTILEERVNNMDAEARVHFDELRRFIRELVSPLGAKIDAVDRKLNVLIGVLVPTLLIIAGAIVALELRG